MKLFPNYQKIIVRFLTLVLFLVCNQAFSNDYHLADSLHQVTLNSNDKDAARLIQQAFRYFGKSPERTDDGLYFAESLIDELETKGSHLVLANFYQAYARFLFENTTTSDDSVSMLWKKAQHHATLTEDGKVMIELNGHYLRAASKKMLKLNADSMTDTYIQFTEKMDISNDDKMLWIAKAYWSSGQYYLDMNEHSNALENFDLAITYLGQVDSSTEQAQINKGEILTSIGYQFYKSGYNGRAKQLLLDAVKIREKYNRQSVISTNYQILGAIYKNEKRFDSALYYFRSAYEVDSALNFVTSKAGSLENMGIVYKDLGQLDKALAMFERAIEIRKQLNQPQSNLGLYVNISNVYILNKEYDQAEKYLQKALTMTEGLKGAENIRVMAFQNMAELHAQKGMYKEAYDYHIQYKNAADSLTSLQIKKDQAAFDKRLELTEKNARLALSQETIKNQKAQNEKQKKILIVTTIGIIALIILVIVIFLYGKQKRKNQKLIFDSEQEKRQNEILKLLNANEISNMNAFMKGQEKERSRIASDLHDRLGSLLSTVKLHFSALQVSLEQSGSEHLDSLNNTIALLDKSVDEVRSVSHNLTKGVITQFGLLAAVETIQEAINATGKLKMVVVDTGFDTRLESEVEINLFRVIQEMVTNAIKHARAKELIIQFVQNDDSINIIVEDDGVGFNPNQINSDGIGLQNMYNRINEIGATYNLDTKIGNGTTYVIELNFEGK